MDPTDPVTSEQTTMPTEQSVLLPELGAAGQESQSNAIAIGELGSFHLAVEHDELLTEHRVSGDQIGAAASHT